MIPVRSSMLRAAPLAAAIVCTALTPGRGAAQQDPRLVAAVRLAQEGQGDSARATVKRLLDATPVAQPLYAEALYTQGVVAATTADMERAFQRLVVEFNGSAWADDALLKLMQLNFARGDLAGVARTAERLRADYPASEVIPEAAVWAARTYFRQRDQANGCRWLADGLARADSLDVELRNELTFLNGRCLAPPDSGAAPAPAGPATPATSTWSVQVAASASQVNADALVQRLARDGHPGAYVVAEGGVFKVRLGRLPARADADALAAELRRGYGPVFVVEERP